MNAFLLMMSLLAADPGPIDFDAIPRAIKTPPPIHSNKPLYGLFLFGPKGETRIWAILDQSGRDVEGYDTLWLDLDADGVMAEEGERFSGEWDERCWRFDIGDLKVCGPVESNGDALGRERSSLVHKEFQISSYPDRVMYRMRWRGEKITMGNFGPNHKTYGNFGTSPSNAPIIVPGYDLPFQFESWASEKLNRGKANDFKVFVGNRGSVRGTFSCVDDKFLPKDESVVAILICKDVEGNELRVESKLLDRC